MAVKLKKLKDQVIVVTGASSGIGLCTAESAARQGAKVVLAARSGETLDDAVSRINAAGPGEAHAVVCDVSDRKQVDNLVGEALDALRVEVEYVDKAPVSVTLIQPTAVDTPFDEHARNYMEQEAKLPSSMIDPQDVADAILKAAVKPKQWVKVGKAAKVNAFAAKNFPGMADRMTARQVDDLHRDESPRDPAGTLHAPSEDGGVRGDHEDA